VAQQTFTVPEFKQYPVVPILQEGALAKCRPYVANAKIQDLLGFPGKLIDNWQEVALAKFAELLGKYRSLKVYLDACVHCGACADKCQFFLGSGDPKNMPVARADLLRKIYRRYFTAAGKLLPGVVGAEELTKEVLEDWYTYFYQCSECRRCSLYCPYGIDTSEITMAAREIMNAVGLGQKYTNEIIGKVHRIGNNIGLPPPAMKNTLESLEDDMKTETGLDIRMPLDEKGAEVMLVVPSADYFGEPHVYAMMGYAKVFHAAGISWTLSTHASEGGNFGMFIGNYEHQRKIALRVREAALDLGVKRIVAGECGHAWRAAYARWNTLAGPFDFLDPKYLVPQHICEVTYDLMRSGAISFDRSANDRFVVTFHDSCNPARATRIGAYPGGQFEIPRAIIREVANHFVEMSPDTIRERTFCCGAGAGVLTDEMMDARIKGAYPRMQALQAVVESDGVNFLATICAICKAQFTTVLPYYKYDMNMVGGVHQLVSNAIRLGRK
jgi:Fe-S oxidoreductase